MYCYMLSIWPFHSSIYLSYPITSLLYLPVFSTPVVYLLSYFITQLILKFIHDCPVKTSIFMLPIKLQMRYQRTRTLKWQLIYQTADFEKSEFYVQISNHRSKKSYFNSQIASSKISVLANCMFIIVCMFLSFYINLHNKENS